MWTAEQRPRRITDPEQIPDFLHALRHELVQPMHTLGLLLDLLPANGDQQALAAWSERSLRALDSLKAMLRVLGEVAKLDLQPPQAARKELLLGPLLAGLATRHRELAEGQGTRIKVVPTSRAVMGDADLLRLGLDALLDNALRHAGGTVLLGVKRHGGRMLVSVWDRGPGFDVDEAAWLSQDFKRGEAVGTTSATGLGLGLGLARRVAWLLGGEFWLKSKPGHGTGAGFLLDPA